jgi:hypothetical protein
MIDAAFISNFEQLQSLHLNNSVTANTLGAWDRQRRTCCLAEFKYRLVGPKLNREFSFA